jgi:hypothetical protein
MQCTTGLAITSLFFNQDIVKNVYCSMRLPSIPVHLSWRRTVCEVACTAGVDTYKKFKELFCSRASKEVLAFAKTFDHDMRIYWHMTGIALGAGALLLKNLEAKAVARNDRMTSCLCSFGKYAAFITSVGLFALANQRD